MAKATPLSAASERAQEYGDRYAEVLARWAALFAAASDLVRANVELSRHTSASAQEFEELLRQTAAAPYSWFNPEMMQRYMSMWQPQAAPKDK